MFPILPVMLLLAKKPRAKFVTCPPGATSSPEWLAIDLFTL
jgi:hypothetical protein